MLNFTFDIITISESKLKNQSIVNIEIPGYQPPCTTEAEKGGTMIYVKKNGINYKVWKDLKIYPRKSLESTFVELINDKEINGIGGVIYRHTSICRQVKWSHSKIILWK